MKKELSFEEAMERLDAIVMQMEQGSATLDESLGLFEEGTELIRLCNKKLDDAELKVVQLMKGSDSEPTEKEFSYEE